LVLVVLFSNAHCNVLVEKLVLKELIFRDLDCSDIRGVAVSGVEGEPVNLTEPITEAIAAGFAGWLDEKKKVNGSRKLKVSIGHDSRISADSLQVMLYWAR
jgi:phosphomannomutase